MKGRFYLTHVPETGFLFKSLLYAQGCDQKPGFSTTAQSYVLPQPLAEPELL